MTMSATIHAPQCPQQPEIAEKPVFRSTRDQKMKESLNLAACLDALATERLASELAPRRGQSVTLNAADVTFVGALPLQLLFAAHRQWQSDGKAFHIVNASRAFLEGVALLGIAPAALGVAEQAEGAQ